MDTMLAITLISTFLILGSAFADPLDNVTPLTHEMTEAINKMDLNWKAADNFPEGFTVNNFTNILGVYDEFFYIRNRAIIPIGQNYLPSVDIRPRFTPGTFDARTKWPACADIIGRIPDGGNCGSAWATVVASVISDRICIQSNGQHKVNVSANELMEKCKEKCGRTCLGGWPGKALEYWRHNGLSIEGSKKRVYPKVIYSLAPWKEEIVRTEIMERGSVEAVVTIHPEFSHYKEGVFKPLTNWKKQLGRHSVKVIGWGVENGVPYWLCINNWGKKWGMEGIFKAERKQVDIERNVMAGIPDLSHL